MYVTGVGDNHTISALPDGLVRVGFLPVYLHVQAVTFSRVSLPRIELVTEFMGIHTGESWMRVVGDWFHNFNNEDGKLGSSKEVSNQKITLTVA